MVEHWMPTASFNWLISLVWFILRPCQHDDGYIDGQSQSKVHTDARTQVDSARSSLAVTHPRTNRGRRYLTSVNVQLSLPWSPPWLTDKGTRAVLDYSSTGNMLNSFYTKQVKGITHQNMEPYNSHTIQGESSRLFETGTKVQNPKG